MDLTTERDEAEIVKKWLRENGLSIILGLVIGGGGIFGWNYYQGYQAKQNKLASDGFIQLTTQNAEEYLIANDKFTSDNSSSVYAVSANMIAAAKAVEVQDVAKARKSLEWVMQNAKITGFQLLARLNLARIEINEKNYAEAIKLLQGTDAKSFAGQYTITLADAYTKKGDTTKARELYNKAKLLTLENPDALNLIDMKLNNLGE